VDADADEPYLVGATIRSAEHHELEDALLLWLAMLGENHEIGGEILPSKQNIDVYRGIMSAYLTGAAQGVVLVAEREGDLVGVLVWGEGGANPFETRWGRCAMGWGVYVRPGARGLGLSTALRTEGRRMLRDMGFDSVLGSAVDANMVGIASALNTGGARRHGVIGVIDLRTEDS
jgi:GNAT superfamily N-acetyltransferase